VTQVPHDPAVPPPHAAAVPAAPPLPGKQEPPPRKAKRRTFIAFGATLVVLAAGGSGLYFALRGGDEADIRMVVDRFVTAVDTGDSAEIVALLCPEEAAGISENDDVAAIDPSDQLAAPITHPREITDVEVVGDIASTRVSRPNQDSFTLYLRRDGEAWKVCADAKPAFHPNTPS